MRSATGPEVLREPSLERVAQSGAVALRRNLVVVRAGDASLHRAWAQAGRRDFDCFVSYFGREPRRHADAADFLETRPGPKWPGLAALLAEHGDLVRGYDAVWFPDDDLAVSAGEIDRMFAFFHAYDLCLAQPALTRDSPHTWNTLLQQPGCHLRYGGFVEAMAPIFSRAALERCAPTFGESPSGWGLDWLWPVLCRAEGLDRIAVIDATPVRHTRPVGGELYANHPELDPRGDAERVLRKYGIAEVRAVAKYAFEREVRDRPLPPAVRALYWLKRLNGRRKHRAAA